MERNERSSLSTLEHVVVLGCSRSTRQHLGPLMERLAARGNPVEIVSGLDSSAVPWTDAVRRVGQSGVYVLCGSSDLSPEYLTQLERAALARGIERTRVWVGMIDWTRPETVLPVVDALLRGRRVQTAEVPKATAATSKPPISARPVIGTDATVAPTSRPVQRTIVGVGMGGGGMATPHPDFANRGTDSTPASPPSPPRSKTQQNPAVPPPAVPPKAPVAAAPGPAPAPPSTAPKPPSAPVHSTSEVVAAGSAGSGYPSPNIGGLSSSGAVRLASGAEEDDDLGHEFAPLRRKLARSLFGSRARVLTTVSLTGLACLGILAASIDTDSEATGVARAEVDADVHEEREATAREEMLEASAVEADEPKKDPLAVAGEPTTALPTNLGAEPEARADVAPEAEPADANPLEVELDEPGEPGEPEDVTPPSDDTKVVYEALRNREIRAFDTLLVAPIATKKYRRRARKPARMDYEEARSYCAALEVAGVTGWRLPSIGELGTLAEGHLLHKRNTYWSATEGDAFGEDRVVWNARKDRMGPAPGRWKGGQTLCVRTRILGVDDD